jgi:HAD superfamily hydrolase (TIGR01484 family)
VLPKDANKGTGVEALLKHLQTRPEDVVAFGDGENDVEMLSLVGCGVAVGGL